METVSVILCYALIMFLLAVLVFFTTNWVSFFFSCLICSAHICSSVSIPIRFLSWRHSSLMSEFHTFYQCWLRPAKKANDELDFLKRCKMKSQVTTVLRHAGKTAVTWGSHGHWCKETRSLKMTDSLSQKSPFTFTLLHSLFDSAVINPNRWWLTRCFSLSSFFL